MTPYREFQTFWFVILAAALMAISTSILYFLQLGSRPLDLVGLLLVNGIMIVMLALSYAKVTEVSEENIRVYFGVGLIRRSIPLNRIKASTIVKSPWYYGWGVRLIPDGWLFNVSGAYSVEIQFTDTDRILRIGSHTPQQLHGAIQAGLRKKE